MSAAACFSLLQPEWAARCGGRQRNVPRGIFFVPVSGMPMGDAHARYVSALHELMSTWLHDYMSDMITRVHDALVWDVQLGLAVQPNEVSSVLSGRDSIGRPRNRRRQGLTGR